MSFNRSTHRFILISLSLLGFLLNGSVQAATFHVLSGSNDIGGANTPIAAEFGIAEGSVAATTLIADALVTTMLVKTANEADTIAAIGFNFTPVPAVSTASASFNFLNFPGFGSTDVYLSQNAVIDGGDTMATLSAVGDSFLLALEFGSSPFFVIFDWANTVDAGALSFTVGVTEVSAVPIPAAIWLFGTALIGFIGVSRKTRVS